jgi:hypothetical protein
MTNQKHPFAGFINVLNRISESFFYALHQSSAVITGSPFSAVDKEDGLRGK